MTEPSFVKGISEPFLLKPLDSKWVKTRHHLFWSLVPTSLRSERSNSVVVGGTGRPCGKTGKVVIGLSSRLVV